MATDVQHVLTILAVEDLAASSAFYRSGFDWTPAVETPVYIEFRLCGGARIGLYERKGFGRNIGKVPALLPEAAIAPTEIYFYADDLSSAVRRLQDVGAQCLSPRAMRPWGDEAAYFADPSGNVIVLASPQGQ